MKVISGRSINSRKLWNRKVLEVFVYVFCMFSYTHLKSQCQGHTWGVALFLLSFFLSFVLSFFHCVFHRVFPCFFFFYVPYISGHLSVFVFLLSCFFLLLSVCLFSPFTSIRSVYFFTLSSFLLYCLSFLFFFSPWYNRHGWLGVKNLSIYLTCVTHSDKRGTKSLGRSHEKTVENIT